MFEAEFDAMLKKQTKEARGQRTEMLERDLAGTKLMLEVLYPVLGTLEGIILEYEMTALSGVKMYSDVYIKRLRTVLEEEHFITHAETITRKRFSFERARARTIAVHGYSYFPYGRDELEKQPDQCRKDFQSLIDAKANTDRLGVMTLPVYEREILRSALWRANEFQLSDVSSWLGLKKETARKVLRSLEEKQLIRLIGGGDSRCHKFCITEKAVALFR
ncbi:hypothetical protein [Cohnella soli]|uniref:MarR family transcriptional regulator n=1 Tax=Cohnella soli TaxID=425005 RepID=A0ABW0HPP1_9BACL